MKFDLNKLLITAGTIVLVLVIVFIIWWNKPIIISNVINLGNKNEIPKSLITGLDCPDTDVRPVAVMMPSDPEARPLSGISQADMVFEMPVDPSGITRFMAVFQCEKPKEIGSVRSARNDFIPLAAGMKSIYAHWGGEHGALEKLDNHIVDNIDALKYEGEIFYRKTGVRPPHNGFTNMDLLAKKAQDLKYDFKNNFSGYSHQDKEPNKNISNLTDKISVNYSGEHAVSWAYDTGTNLYSRFRNGSAEIDKSNGQIVKAGVVVVMNTTSKFLKEQYISVDVQGEGTAQIYQNGSVINGKWQKDVSQLDSKLYFYDDSEKEIKFAPGKIWVEIVTQ
jgi:predicted lipoprotein